MILLCAAGAFLAAGSVTSAWLLGFRRRSDVLTASLSITLLFVTLVSKALLLWGLYGPYALLGASAVFAGGAAAPAYAVPGARERVLAGAAEFRPRRVRPTLLASVALAGVLGVYAYRAAMAVLLPPRDIDSLWYHLVSIAGWIQHGDLTPAIENLDKSKSLDWTVVSDSYPRDFELVGAWFAVFTRNTTFVGLTQIVFAVLLFSGTYGICRRLAVRRTPAIVAASAVVLAPIVIGQVYMLFNDVARAAVPAAVWHLLLIAFPSIPQTRRNPLAPLVLAGGMLGLGLGIKASNGYLIPFAIGSAVLLYAARRRQTGERGAPGPIVTVLALGLPATLIGVFWYALTWYRWGSPVWPLRLGPFAGPMEMFTLVDGQRPTGWKHASDSAMLLHSWTDALATYGKPYWYAEWTGQLGLAWLLVMLPAVAIVTVTAVFARRHRVAAFAVVLPMLCGTLAAPGAWFARYTIPVLIAGGVAVAVLAGSGPRPDPLRVRAPARFLARLPLPAVRLPRLGTLVVAALLVVAVVSAVPGLRWSNFRANEGERDLTFRQNVATLRQPPKERARAGLWRMLPEVGRLPAGTRIGFCTDDAPRRYAPFLLIGRDFRTTLVNIGPCRTAEIAKVRMVEHDVDYLYASDRSPMGKSLPANRVGLRTLTDNRKPVGTCGVINVYRRD